MTSEMFPPLSLRFVATVRRVANSVDGGSRLTLDIPEQFQDQASKLFLLTGGDRNIVVTVEQEGGNESQI